MIKVENVKVDHVMWVNDLDVAKDVIIYINYDLYFPELSI